MRLPTKSLIDKIEKLSAQMTPQQLSDFLDILDSMTIMVEDAIALPTETENNGHRTLKLAFH